MILSFYELPEKDRPPEDIWLDPEALAGHFENVRASYRSDRDNDPGRWQAIEDVPMTENQDDLVRMIKHGR